MILKKFKDRTKGHIPAHKKEQESLPFERAFLTSLERDSTGSLETFLLSILAALIILVKLVSCLQIIITK